MVINIMKAYKKINKICKHCGIEYYDVPKRRLKFCSLKCWKETITNRKTFICKNCGIPYIVNVSRNTIYCSRKCMYEDYKGRIVPDSVKLKITMTKLAGREPTEARRIRKLKRFSDCRKEVLNRDNFTCQICFNSGIDVHHIKPIYLNPELSFEVSNLITLCKSCHDKKVSHHEIEWQDYFNKILKPR